MNDNAPSNFGMDAAEEHRLLQRARRGDRASYLVLVQNHLRPVYRLAFALTRDVTRARELTRETFVRARQGVRYMPEAASIYPWLARITRNLALSNVAAPDLEYLTLALPAVENDQLDVDVAMRYLTAVASLEPDDQLALALRVVERLPYSDIEAVLQTAPGSILTRLSNARAALTAALPPVSGEHAA
ncbi:MAG: RNA polymerase sigma factor [Candidatus Eisenbacteria bacterium]|uniref:RNA polymerase sigma factor n=1 Tax=Eiseniibacteriota bacterium TaxID=2212470 RepID=A0A849SG77_UNCEI|nr:RNA polymerase sigma factor [Candidatus Eisenbacteria bacterium]